MAQVINTNSLSLVAQNNLNKSQAALGTAIQRLSSGLRINSAKDDAAGQAISNRFTASINGLSQASRNANDGISIAQTTEGALNEINDNLQNIRRLTVQAQNGTNSDSDRASIQAEIDQRLQEINRISEQTEFNGVKVLSEDQTLTIQVGANDGQTISIDLSKMDATTLGMDSFSINDGVDVSSLTDATTYTAKEDAAEATKTLTDGKGLPFTSIVKGDDNKYYGVGKNASDADSWTELTIGADGKVTAGTESTTEPAGAQAVTEIEYDAAIDTTGLNGGTLKTDGKDKFYVDHGDGTYTLATLGSDGKAVDTGKAVSTSPATTDPLSVIDAALSQVDDLRSTLGAVQNRFDSVINNLNSTVNNLSASQSRILDADYATEVSNMSRAQILQQAGTTVLSQANQVPQNVLSLLR